MSVVYNYKVDRTCSECGEYHARKVQSSVGVYIQGDLDYCWCDHCDTITKGEIEDITFYGNIYQTKRI